MTLNTIPRVSLVDKVWLTVSEACAVGAIGRTTLYEAIAAGHLVARKRGRRTIIQRKDLDAWLEGLPMLDSRKVVGEKPAAVEKRRFPWEI